MLVQKSIKRKQIIYLYSFLNLSISSSVYTHTHTHTYIQYIYWQNWLLLCHLLWDDTPEIYAFQYLFVCLVPSLRESGPTLCCYCTEQASCCYSRGSSRALPEFLVWPLVNFYWLRRPRTLISNILFDAQCRAIVHQALYLSDLSP